jgi:hypothetical protein
MLINTTYCFLDIHIWHDFVHFAEKHAGRLRANDIKKVMTALYRNPTEPDRANYGLFGGNLTPWMIRLNIDTVKRLTDSTSQLFLNTYENVSNIFSSHKIRTYTIFRET